MVRGAPKQYNSNKKDHWLQITMTNMIIMRTFEILWEFQNVTWRPELSQCSWKNGASRLALQSCLIPSICKNAWVCAESCPTLCDPRDCSPPGPSVHGIFSARILKWIAISSSRESSWPRNQTHVPSSLAFHVDSLLLTHWGIFKNAVSAKCSETKCIQLGMPVQLPLRRMDEGTSMALSTALLLFLTSLPVFAGWVWGSVDPSPLSMGRSRSLGSVSHLFFRLSPRRLWCLTSFWLNETASLFKRLPLIDKSSFWLNEISSSLYIKCSFLLRVHGDHLTGATSCDSSGIWRQASSPSHSIPLD